MEKLGEKGFGREPGEQPPNFEAAGKAAYAVNLLFGVCRVTKRWMVTI
jgi:hypothetical protein